MAARTASVSGDWSNTATWGGAAVPVSGDTFTINVSVVVDFDVDQSGMAAGMGASVITGTLRFKRAAGTYILKMNGNLSGTGIIDASDGAGGAYVGGQVAEILFNTALVVSVSGVQNVICLEPTHKYCKLSQAESAAATTIHVDTDLTGEATYWKTGDLIRVDNVNAGAQSEQYTISSVTSTTIVLTSGLTNSKLIGSYVVLVSRNVKVIGAGTGGGTGFSAPGSGSILSAEIRNIANGLGTPSGATIGGVISGCTTGMVTNPANCVLNGVISGCTTAISGGFNLTINGLISGCTSALLNVFGAWVLSSTGIVTGCVNAISASSNGLINGSVLNSTNGIVNTTGVCSGAILSGNTNDLNNLGNYQLFNTLLADATEFASYNSAIRRAINSYVESIDHDQVVGAFRAWTLGGITSSVASPVYDNRVRSYNAVCESASAYAFWQRQVYVPAGGSLYVEVAVQKDASMSYLPNVQVFPASVEPLITGSPSLTLTMTNSTNTWEVLTGTVTNTTDAAVMYTVRFLAKNASGNVYWSPVIRTSGFQIDTGMAGGMAA